MLLNVLFLTLSSMENVYEKNIYTDLVRELARQGMNMHIVFPRERRMGLPTELAIQENIKLLKVKTGNIMQTNLLEKGISTLTIESKFLRATKKYFKGIRFDLILYSTPPITFERVVKYFKKRDQSITYLILKDIFPQNAVDMKMMKSTSLICKYFRKKERKLYEISDKIGCMSEGNVHYLLKHHPYLDGEKVEIFPNAIEPMDDKEMVKTNGNALNKYDHLKDAILFVYGGNLGKPQGIDFLIEVAQNFHRIDKGYLLIIGSGTEYNKISTFINEHKPKNVNLLPMLPKEEYDQLLFRADVGLIFLDKRFTIPNIPSRLTSYMEYSLPVLAATDRHTDLREILTESKSGFWSESGDLESFLKHANKLATNQVLRRQMGENGRRYLEEHYDVRKTAPIIVGHLRKGMQVNA